MAEQTETTTEPDRFQILVDNEDYNGHHPVGIRFMNGEAITEDAELAKRARGMGLVVRKVKRRAEPTPAKK